ncbi:MAG TPA: IS3 family transposase [Candidatus Saccharimonadales bacterium]|nr:IS3 family transposase [Candidatus Saccharimonadales bacterium]
MCLAAGVSRASYYRDLQEKEPDQEQLLVRAAIQEVVLQHRRRYGYRRVTAELRRRGLCVNHKRTLRLMREDNLLALTRRGYVLTTDSEHELEVFLNLAARMTPSGINQLWVADLTYIRLAREFVYLAVVLDRYSRRVVGWALDRTLEAALPLTALRRAIQQRAPLPGLVHHSDRGVQYCSREYVEVLQQHRMVASMSRPGNPYDNAFCESFMKTLKREEIHCNQYRDLADLSLHVEEFIEHYYNSQRLHSALGYRSPQEFEAACADAVTSAPRVKFFQASGDLPIR